MNKIINLALILALIVSSSCTKTQVTTLQIKALNTTGDPVPDVGVVLYKSQADMASGTNKFDVQFTDNSGFATFSLNSANGLFFSAYRTSDCATNAFSKSKTGTLNSGQLNVIETTVTQIGNVTFTNNSSDTYNIYINGTLWQPLLGGSSSNTVMKVGTYSIHVTQVSNISGTPKEKDYHINITSCSTQAVDFPN
jgi:5-hydroxyisourate hydrolase-like protein (transthyretin family)